MEKFKDEAQLKSGRQLPEGSVEILQAKSVRCRFIPELLITALIIGTVFFTGHTMIKHYDKPLPETDLKFCLEFIGVFAVCFLMLPLIHELIHALVYPVKADKKIWRLPSSYFVYCEAEMNRNRMVLVLVMPLVLLGLLPFIAWMVFLSSLPGGLAYILLIADLYMIFLCISDIGAIWVTLRYVPKKAKVFSSGVHYYYRMDDRR